MCAYPGPGNPMGARLEWVGGPPWPRSGPMAPLAGTADNDNGGCRSGNQGVPGASGGRVGAPPSRAPALEEKPIIRPAGVSSAGLVTLGSAVARVESRA